MPYAPSAFPGRPCWAEIDLDALAANTRLLVARAAPARLYAVVKANAYGHGAVACGRAALAAGAHGLAVVCVDEAEELRLAGVTAPLLVVGYTPPSDAARVVALGLMPTVGAEALALALSEAATAAGAVVPVHLEVETGLNRHGLLPEECVALAERLRTLPGLEPRGLFTHFAAAEEGDQRFTRSQFEVLRRVSERLPFVAERHCAASATVLLDHEMALDAVRAGLSLYGYRPAPWVGTDADLRPVLSLRARVARVLEVARGATVGYGRTWAAARPARIALVMCGYADGYRRGLGNRAHVLVRGRRAPVVGRVAMDMCMVDVTAVPEAAVGDVATLIGRDGAEEVTADDLASLGDTISWEILAGLSARVPRLYLSGGQVTERSTLAARLPRSTEAAPRGPGLHLAFPLASRTGPVERYRPLGDGREVLVNRGRWPGEHDFPLEQRAVRLGPTEAVLVRYRDILSPPPLDADQGPLDPAAAARYQPEVDVIVVPEGEITIPRLPEGFSDEEEALILEGIWLER